MSEFQIIEDHFSRLGASRPDVLLGVGDDAAILSPPKDQQLVTALDTLVAGVHFPETASAEDIGHKALAVNLSDLAAMGAEPAWATLGLTLPEQDETWLAGFCRGFDELASAFGLQLVGGDTTRGPLTISVNVTGFAPEGRIMRRRGAKPGDLIYVTGVIGEAGLGLKLALDELELPVDQARPALERLHRPMPRVNEGLLLRSLASAAIDVSDGLLADLGHVLAASGVGARLELERIPLSVGVRAVMGRFAGWTFPLTAGDDYELCFALAPERAARLDDLRPQMPCGCHRIGVIEAEPGLRCIDGQGARLDLQGGYDHFGGGTI